LGTSQPPWKGIEVNGTVLRKAGLGLLFAVMSTGACLALDPVFAVNRSVYRPDFDSPVVFVVRSPEFGSGGIWIYNSSGELIAYPFRGRLEADRSVTVTWAGKNTMGEKVSAGMYLVYILTEFETKVLKILLLR